jgi:hypothetical protein
LPWWLLLGFRVFEIGGQRVEPLLPESVRVVEPAHRFAQVFRPERDAMRPSLALPLEQPGGLEHSQMPEIAGNDMSNGRASS